jgi:WD40 repeat protein
MYVIVTDKGIHVEINAHESDVGALAVNAEGTLIASASIRGTIIRVFSAEDGKCLQELRRGSGKAFITSIIFHPTLHLIACTSNKSSIHLFEINKSTKTNNTTVDESMIKNVDGENKKSK